MAELAPMRLPDAVATVRFDPAETCPTCATQVTEAEATVSIRTVPGERHGDTIDLHLQATGITLTAACGHVIHQEPQ